MVGKNIGLRDVVCHAMLSEVVLHKAEGAQPHFDQQYLKLTVQSPTSCSQMEA